MKVIYNIAKRKPFVKALKKITGAKAIYKRTPTYAYEVDYYFTITREGNLVFNDMADSEEIECVLDALAKHGFHYENSKYDEPQPDTNILELSEDCSSLSDTHKTLDVTISIPLENVAVGNLTNLLESRVNLIKKALGIESLPISIGGLSISFNWFSTVLPEADEVNAYTQLIAVLCKMSKDQKRVLATAKPVQNENMHSAVSYFILALSVTSTRLQENFCSETLLVTGRGRTNQQDYHKHISLDIFMTLRNSSSDKVFVSIPNASYINFAFFLVCASSEIKYNASEA